MIGPSDIQIILGKVRPFLRRLAEAHPQVLIIAQYRDGTFAMVKFDDAMSLRRVNPAELTQI